MSGWLLLYEDARWHELSPIADLTPVPALAFGGSTLAERWAHAANRPLLGVLAWSRARGPSVSAPAARPKSTDDVLVVNAAVLPGPWLEAALTGPPNVQYVHDDRVAAARVPFSGIERAMRIAELFGTAEPAPRLGDEFEPYLTALGLREEKVEARFLAHPWDVIARNPDALARDLAGEAGEVRGTVHRLAAIESPDHVTVAAGARVDAFAVLDARAGPIRIGAGAIVLAHSVVIGPCAIGAGTHILGGVVAGSTIGPQCRVAGEVEASVWQGFANKRHHGFVGHSAIGEWVNLGALTTTSDLKNNYGTVRVWCGGQERDSGHAKIGAIIGAHVKTGIGTLLPTGASLGVGSNLFGGGRLTAKRVASFSWWNGERAFEHELEKFLATARTAMKRRERELSAAEEAALRRLFEATRPERAAMTAGAP